MVRKVAVIMGSDSDWPVVKGACAQLKALDIPFEAHITAIRGMVQPCAKCADRKTGNKGRGTGVPQPFLFVG